MHEIDERVGRTVEVYDEVVDADQADHHGRVHERGEVDGRRNVEGDGQQSGQDELGEHDEEDAIHVALVRTLLVPSVRL